MPPRTVSTRSNRHGPGDLTSRPCRACSSLFEPVRWWQEICPICGPAGRAAYWRNQHRKEEAMIMRQAFELKQKGRKRQKVVIMRRALEWLLARKARADEATE